MLNKDNFKKGIMGLYVSFQHKGGMEPPDKAMLSVWYQALNDIPNEDFQKACIFIIRNHDWFPTIKDIRKAAGFSSQVANETDTTAEQQWELVKAAVSAFGRNRQPIFGDQITQNAVDSMGWQDFCDSNIQETGNWRARFLKTYENISEHGLKHNEMVSISKLMGLVSFPEDKKKKLD